LPAKFDDPSKKAPLLADLEVMAADSGHIAAITSRSMRDSAFGRPDALSFMIGIGFVRVNVDETYPDHGRRSLFSFLRDGATPMTVPSKIVVDRGGCSYASPVVVVW